MESKKFMAQNATLRRENTPLPGPMDFSSGRMPENLKVCVANVLNKVPTTKRAAVLQWIMGSAAVHASSARVKIANWVRQELWNRFQFNPNWSDETWEEAVFNKQAYKEVPQLGQMADEIEEKWFSDPENEPDIIPIRDSKNSTSERGAISLHHINAMLLRDGMTPLVFGGPDGYLSYMEKGHWNDKKISRGTNFGNQGHDMSLRRSRDYQGYKTDPLTNTQFPSLGNAKKIFDPKDLELTGEKHQGGYNPLNNLSTIDSAIFRSERNTRSMLDKIAGQIESGVKVKELDHPDMAFLKSMIRDGKLNPEVVNDEEELLAQIAGISNKDAVKEIDDETGKNVPWVRVGGNDEQYTMMKASAKASLEYLLQLPPGEKNPGNGLGNDHSANPWPWASIRISGQTPIDLNPENPNTDVDKPEVRKNVVDKLMNLIFNDSERTCLKTIASIRNGERGIKRYSKVQKYNTRIPVSSLMIGKNGTGHEALRFRKDVPVSVSIDGKNVEIDPKEILGNDKGARKFINRKFKFGGEFAPTFQQSELDKSYTREQVQKLIDDNNYKVGGNGTTFITLWFNGSSDIRKFVKLADGNWGEIVTSPGQPINPSTSLKPLDKHNTVALAMLNGKEILVRKIKTPDGHDQWVQMPPGVKTDDIRPILGSIRPSFNVAGGVRDKMEFDPERQTKEWDYFMNNLEKFNDIYNKEFNTAQSIVHGVKSANQVGRKGFDASKYIGDAIMDVQAHIANQSFRYGTPEILKMELAKRSKSVDPTSIERPDVGSTHGTQSLGQDSDPTSIERPNVGSTHGTDDADAAKLARIKAQRDLLRSSLGQPVDETDPDAAKKLARIKAQRDLLRSLGESVRVHESNEDGDEQSSIIKFYKHVVFDLAGDVEAHDGPPKIVNKTLYVNPEMLDAILQSGYIWRKRKAANAAVNSYKADPKAQSTGTGGGGGGDDEMDHWANVADNDEDDELEKQAAIDSGEADYDDNNRGRHSRGSYDSDTSDFSSFDIGQGETDSVDDEIARLEAEKAKAKKGEFTQSSPQQQFGQAATTRSSLARGYSSSPNLPMKQATDRRSANLDSLRAAGNSGPVDTNKLNNIFGTQENASLKGYAQWLIENEAIHDPKVKIKDGCGFNWWGAAGDPLGVSISGKADSSKSDPTGKGKVGKSRTPRK